MCNTFCCRDSVTASEGWVDRSACSDGWLDNSPSSSIATAVDESTDGAYGMMKGSGKGITDAVPVTAGAVAVDGGAWNVRPETAEAVTGDKSTGAPVPVTV